MRRAGIGGVRLREKVRTTIPARPDPGNGPDPARLTVATPNQKYVGYITYLPIGDGRLLYLATALDLNSNVWSAGRSPSTCAPNWSLTR
jgi:transposase InsO family protein